MRVVRIQSRICVGGPALHCILLTEGLSHRNGSRYDTTLISGALEPGEVSMESFASERGVQFQVLPEMGRSVRPWADAVSVARLVRMLRRLKPDIVHTHTAKAGAVGRVAARMAGVPHVLHTFHGHVFEGYFSGRKAQAFVQVERGLARLTDRIFAISEEQRRDLVERYRIAPAEKVQVVPLGLDLGRFRQIEGRSNKLRAELTLDESAQVILAVGRMVPIKRFDRLIDAFALVDRSSSHLVLVGDGETRASLEAQVRTLPPDVAARVHFTGMRHDLPELYADADLVALSSDNEGTPVAVIEALAAGVPVVATRVGGVPSVVDSPELGSLVEPNPPDLARSIAQRLDAGGSLPESARDEVFQKFSHHRLLRDVQGVYDALVSVRSRSPAGRQAEGIS